jgi:hypothetical protein
MKRPTTLLLGLTMLVCGAALAQSARPPDSDVQKMIEGTGKYAQTFQRALDKNVKNSIVRSASGEMKVSLFLEDLNTSIERVKDRFKPDYAASSEVNALLHRAGEFNDFVQSQPPTLKGRSEWDSFASSLNTLAAAYGSTFPMKDVQPRRINDREIEQAADAAVKNGQSLSRSLSKVFGKEDKEAMKAAQDQIDAMSKAAKALKARIDDRKPASGEAAAFTQSAQKVRASLGDRTLTVDAKTAADGIDASRAKVEQAFGMADAE